MASPVPSNQDQIDYWNGIAAERWVQNQVQLDQALAPFGAAALDRLGPAPGESILDVGCGTGDTLAQLSLRVGPSGRVVGIDPSRPLLARARERTRTYDNVELIEGDASSHTFSERFDRAFSRFGVMFFADPVQALSHLRGALAPGGRLAFVCWQALEVNPWVSVPLVAAREILKDAVPVPDPDAPGPFAFSRSERVRGILERAGYRGIDIEGFSAPLQLSNDGIDAAVDFASRVGPVARLVAEQPDSVRDAVRAQVRASLLPLLREGRVELEGLAWVVSCVS